MVPLNLINTYSWSFNWIFLWQRLLLSCRNFSCFIFTCHYTELRGVIWYFDTYAHNMSVTSNTYCFFCGETVRISSSHLEGENTLLTTISWSCNRTPALVPTNANFILLDQPSPTSPWSYPLQQLLITTPCLCLQAWLFSVSYDKWDHGQPDFSFFYKWDHGVFVFRYLASFTLITFSLSFIKTWANLPVRRYELGSQK